MVILAAAAFVIRSSTNRIKGYSPGQLIFGRGMILPIKHRMDWELICQKKQTQINRDNTKRINIELTVTINSEINSCSLTTMHTNMRRHINAFFL